MPSPQLKAAKLLAALAVAGLAQQAFAAAPAPNALPTGGKVVAGTAAISQAGNTMNINQSSQRAVINWSSFDVGSNATVNFNQPNAQAATLNYVNSASKSMINGAVNANGQVIFINNNGVVFGKGAEVNVGGMVATTMNTSAKEFMDGKEIQTYEGGTTGKVINKGNITGNNINSYIALMAPQVVNTGVITATMGGNNAIALVAGQKVTLKFSGSQFVSVSVDASVVNALISNKLLINAGNGQVIIGANAAQNLMGSLIKNTGTISASDINTSGGKISLTADSIEQTGTIEANSAQANGGNISLKGNNITLASGSKTTATGATAGGNINVGVNNTSTQSVQNAIDINNLANTVSVQTNATVDASATQSGNGGTINIWSKLSTMIAGALSAKGGAQGGNGGFIETSSKGNVAIAGTAIIDTSAPKGKTGQWTVDPMTLIIDSTAASVISNALSSTNVTLDATGSNSSACAFGACTNSQSPLIRIMAGADIYSSNTATSLNLIATGGQIDIHSNITAGSVYAVAQAINVYGSVNTNGGSNSNIYLAGAIINILGNINSNGNNQNNSSSSNLNSANTITGANRRNGQNGLNADSSTYLSNGGLINILATGNITVDANSYISSNGIHGGAISIVSTAGKTTINGIVDSIGKGLNNAGNGGNIAIVGKTQTDIIAALISSEGLSQGGVINLGQVNNLGNGTILAPPATAPPALSNFANTVVASAVDSNNSITSSNINIDSQTGINAPNGNIVVFGDQIQINNSSITAANGAIAIGRESYGQGALAGYAGITNSALTANKVETSGRALNVDANNIIAIEWLLDPTSVVIGAAAGTSTGTNPIIFTNQATVSAAQIQTAINAGTSVTVIASGTITQTTGTLLAFNIANAASAPTLKLDTTSGTLGTTSKITLGSGITSSGPGTLNLIVLSNGAITTATGSGIQSTSGKINIQMQSFDTSTSGAWNIILYGGVVTRGGYISLDTTGGSINATTGAITRGSINAGGVQFNSISAATGLVSTTTDGAGIGATTTGGAISIATGYTGANGSFATTATTVVNGGSSVTLDLVAGASPIAAGYAIQTVSGSVINAYGNIGITSNSLGTNTDLYLVGTINSFRGAVSLVANDTNTINGSIWLQGAVSAYNGIALTANASQATSNVATIRTTAAGTLTTTNGTVTINSTANNATGIYAVSTAGLITAPQVLITATENTAAGLGVQVTGGVTITAGTYATVGDAFNITSTVGTAGLTGGINVTAGVITNNSNGGNVTYATNGDITATAAVNFAAANTTNHSQTITYDTRAGNLNSQITTGAFSYNATGATQKVNYVEESNGSNLTIGATSVSGYITVDNTCLSCTSTGVSDLTPASLVAAMTTSAGITVSGALSAGDYIYLNGLNNSATVNAIALGSNTLTVTSASTAATAITVIGNHNTANIGNPGIASTGAITDNANGGGILFKSNGDISQTGAVTVAANNSGTASSITYDTTTGNLNSSITPGALTLTGGAAASNTAINYIEKSSGAAITASAVSMPGYILLDNTYGTAGAGGTPTSGYVTYANASTLATTGTGIFVNGVLSSGAYAGTNAVTVNGVSNGVSGTYAVNIATGNSITAATGDINITGLSPTVYGVYALSPITATAGNVNIIGISGSPSSAGVLIGQPTNIVASGNILISGSELATSTNAAYGVWIYGNATTFTKIAAGGNLTIAGFNSSTSTFGTYAIYTGLQGALYLKSGGDTIIAGSTPLGAGGSTGSKNIYLGSLVTNAASLTVEGASLLNQTNSSGTSIPNVATAVASSSATNGVAGGIGIDIQTSKSVIDGTTFTGINATGNIWMSGTGGGGGLNINSVPITSKSGNITLSGSTGVAASVGLKDVSGVITATAGSVSLTGTSTTGTSVSDTATINAVTGVTITGTGNLGVSAGTAGAVSVTGGITNTGSGGVTVTSTGNTATGAITDSGSGGISITGGRSVAAGTTTNGTITAVGTLANTGGGVISLSMAQPTSLTGGVIESAASITTTNASTSSNVSYGNIGGVMGAVNAATVNSVNYRSLAQGISVTLKASYTAPYGTAYNSVFATDWLQNPANATVTVSGVANFGAPLITAAQAQASLIFASAIGGNSNLVQTGTNLDGTTNILSSLGNTVTTTGAGNTYNITPKVLTITGTQLSSTYNGVSTYETVANAGYTISGLVTNFNTGTVASPVTGAATGNTVSSVTHVIQTGSAVLSNTAIAQACSTANCYTDAVSAALGSGLSNYTIVYVSGTFNISKAALVITQGNSTLTYTGSAQTLTPAYSVGGVLGSDSVASVLTNTQTGTNAGSYAGTISGATGSGLSNYTITYSPGTLTVLGISVYITAANDSKVYGSSTTTGAITYNSSGVVTNPASTAYSVTGLLAGNSISGLTLTSTGGIATTGVGSYSIVPSLATISGAGAGNYTVYYTSGSMTITPKPITITANAVTTTYGTTSALSQTAYTVVGGLVTGDAITAATINYGSGTSVPGTTNAGTYAGALVPSGATGTGGFNNTNYTISYAAGNLTVNPLNLTITASAQSGATYGTAYSLGSSAYTQSIATLPNSDVISGVVLQSGGVNLVPGTTNAGSYTITPSAATFSSGIAANYNITYATGALTIGKASLTITPNAVSTTYNGTTLNNTSYSDVIANYSVSGYKNTDTNANTPIALTGSMAFNSSVSTVVKNAATYTYAVGTLAGTSTNTNYNIVWANAPNNTYVINKALATVVATKPYDGTTTFTASTLTITGVGSETLTASAGTGTSNNANVVGVSSLVTSGYTLGNGSTGTTGLASNYILPTSTSSVSITPLTLTAAISGSTQTKVYDTTSTAALTAGSCTVSPCTAGNGVTLSGNAATSGSFTITGFVAGEGAYITTSTGNYINATSGLATPNVTLNALAATAGSQANAVKVVVAPTDILALSNTTLSNYVLPSAALSPTTATITAAPLGVTANNYSMFTGGTAPTAISGVSVTSASPSAPATPSSTSLSAQVSGLLGSDSVAVSLPLPSAFTTASGGSYTLTPTIVASITAGNYNITPTNALLTVVGNQDLVISAGNATHVYGTVTAANLASSATPVVQYCAAVSGSCAGSVINLTVTSTATPNIWSATSTTGAIYNFTVAVATPTYSTGGYANVGSYTATASNNQVIHPDTSSILATYYVTGTVAVTPLVVTPVNNQTPSKVYDATTALTMTPLSTVGMNLAGDSLSMTGTAAYNSKNAGTNVGYTISNLALGSADASNYVLSTSTLAGTNGTITPAPLTVAGLSANNKVYDTTNTATISAAGQSLVGVLASDVVAISSTGNYNGTFSQVNAANTLAVTPTTSTVGGLTVMAGVALAGADSGNYYVAGPSSPLTANITPVAVSLAGTRVYDGTTAFAANLLTVTGIAGQTLTLSGSGAANSADVGIANILSSTSGLALGNGTTGTTGLASNYTLVGATSTISITPAAITVSANDVTKTYDGTTSATSTPKLVSGTLYANASNSGITDSLSGGTYAYTNPNVGSGNKTVTVTGVLANDGNAGANYTISYVNNTTSTITAKSISVAAIAQTKSYGTSDPTLTYSVTGLVPTDSLLVMTGNLLRQGTTASNVASSVSYEQVGTYPIAIGSLSAGSNYVISSFTPANLTITKYATNALTVTADAKTKVYGTNDPTLTYVTTGLPASLTADGLTWSDTAATAVTGSLIRAGMTAPGVAPSATPEAVGTYAITNTYATSPVVSANYNISYVGANLQITPAPLTVSAANQTKSYATNDPTLTLNTPVGLIHATVDGVAIADTSAVLTGNLARAQSGTLAGEQVATSPYAITQGTVAVTGGNYALTFTPGTLTITPYTGVISVTAVNNQKGYGSSDPALTYTVSGLANVTLANHVVINDTLNPTSFFAGNVARAAGENMATYTIGVGTLALNSGAGANYSWTPTNTATFTAGTFTINPATLFVIVADNGKFVFQNDPIPLTTVVYSGFVNGDTSTTAAGLVAPILTRVSAGNNIVGTYAITASGAAASNYNIVYQYTQGVTSGTPNGTNSNFYVAGSNDLLISPAPATAVYGTANANINLGKPVVQTCLSPCAAPSDIVTLNYTGTTNGVLSYVDPAKGSGGVSFVLGTNYDSTTPALRNVDAYTLTPTGITQIANNSGANNYQSTFGLGSTLSITPAAITITSTNVVKSYDGTTAATSGMGASAINVATATNATGIYSDAISGGNFAYASPNACAGTCTVSVSNVAMSGAGVLNALPNYTITYVDNTTSTINKAALTITANAQTKMYGTNDPTLTYVVTGLAASDTVSSVMSGSLNRALFGTLAGEQVNTTAGYAIVQGSLVANANYTTTYVSKALKITPRAIWTGPGAWPGPGPAPEALVVSAVDQTKAYGSNDPSLAYTVTGLVSVTLANGVVINDTAASVFTGGLLRAGTSAPGVATGIASEQVGSYTIANNSTTAPLALTATAQSNYGLAANGFVYNAGTLSITPNAATINIVAANKTKSYATNDPTLTYAVSTTNGSLVNATVDGILINDTAATVTSGSLTRTQYGTLAGEQVTTALNPAYAITQGSVLASPNYAASTFTPATLTITPYATPIAITADAKTKSFATNDPTLTYAVSGLVSGVVVDGVTITDTVAATMSGSLLRVGTLAPGVATSASSENIGSYVINQGSVAPNANYTATYTPANLTITPYATPLTVTANNQSMVYGSANLPTLSYGVSGLVNGAVVDGITLSNTAANVFTGSLATTATAYNGTTGSASNVGNYPIAVGSLALNTGEGANYTFVAANNFNVGTLALTPAPLTIAVADNGKFVFQTDAQVQISGTQISAAAYSGFVNGDALGALKAGSTLTAPTITRAAAGNGVAGTYAITASGAVASNYSISYQYTQGVSSATPNGTNSNFIIAGPYDVLIEAKPTTVMYGTTSVTYTTPVVTYCTSCTGSSSVVTLSGTNVGNNWTFADSLSVSGGVTFTLSSPYSTAAAATRAVGDYAITPTNVAPITTATGGTNYNNLYKVDSALTVTPAPISITTANVTKAYDGLTTTVGAAPITTAGTQTYFGDALSGGTFTYNTANAGAGNKTVIPDLVSISNSGANVASNYVVTYVNNTTSTITPAALTITANAQTKMYGTNDPTLTYAVSGLAATDSVNSVVTGGLLARADTGLLAGEQVGSYAIMQGTLAVSSNYAVTYIANTLTITPRTIWTGPGAWPGPGPAPAPVTVTAVDQTKAYGSNDPSLAYTVTGLVSVTLANGVVINDTAASVFTGGLLRAGTSAPGVATGIASEQVGSYTIANNSTTAPLALTATAQSNYGLAANGFTFTPATLTITPKIAGINVVADNKTKMYATNDPALTFTSSMATGSTLVNSLVDGIQITDTFSNIFTGSITRALVATLPGEQVGSYAITQGTLASPNYTGINYTAGVLTITPRRAWNPATDGPWTGPGPAPQDLTVVANNQTKSYATTDPALTYLVTGLASVTLANGVVINDTPATALSGALTRGLYGTIAGEQVNTTSGYGITQGTLTQNANYAPLVYTGATLTITPYATPIVVTADAKTKSYGTNDPTLSYSVTGLVNGVSVDGVTLIDTPSTALIGNLIRVGTTAPNVATSIASEQVGSYAINQGTIYASNYNITYNAANLTITPYATPLAVVADAKTKVYGSNDPGLTYTVAALPNVLSADGLVWTDTMANSITGNLIRVGTTAPNVATSIASEQVGSYVINQGTLDSTNYNLVFTPANLSITPAVVTVTANPATKSYGTSDPVLTYTTSGILSGVVVDGITLNDTAAIMSGSLSRAQYGTVAGEQVGVYGTTIGGVNAGPNYSTLLIPSTLTITPYAGAITITANNQSMVYGSSNMPSLTYTVGGIPTSFNVDGVTWSDAASGVIAGALTSTATAFNGTAGSSSNVGNYPISQGTVALTAGLGANYSTPTFTAATLAVTPAPLTIAVADNGKFVFQTDAQVQASATQISPVVYSGFVNGDALGALNTGSTLTQPTVVRANASSNVAGTYDISASGAVASNYSISYLYTKAGNTASTFTIAGPYDVLIKAVPNTVVYGTANSAITYGTPTVQYCTSCTGSSSVVTLTGTNAGNNWTFVDNLSVSGGVTFTMASTYSDATAATRGVGAYVVSATNMLPITNTSGATNYNHLYTVDSAMTVTPRPISISTGDVTKSYDGLNTVVNGAPVLTSGTLGFTDAMSGGVYSYTSPSAASGTKVVAVNMVDITSASTNVASNYTVTYVNNTTSTITPAALTITADAKTKMYGTNDPVFTYTISGLAATDNAALAVTGGALTRALINTLPGEQVGSYAISQGTLAVNPNYALTFINGSLSITPRGPWTGPGAWPGPGPEPTGLTVTAVNNTKVYGTNDPALAYTVTGLVNVTLANGVVINDTAASVFGTSYVLRAGMLSPVLASGIGSEQVGEYVINQGNLAVINTNYGSSFAFNPALFTITPKVVTGASIVADNKTKMYGTNDPALTFTASAPAGTFVVATVDGIAINDSAANVFTGQLTRAQVNTLAGEQVTPAGYAITQGSVAGSGNYSGFTYTPAVLTITPRRAWNPAIDGPWTGPGPAPLPLTVTAVPASKMFGAADPVFAYTVTGLVSVTLANGVVIADTPANTFTGALSRAPGENSGGVYAITQGSLLQNANYASMVFESANLTIGLAPQTINNMAIVQQQVAQDFVQDRPTDRIKKGELIYVRDKDNLPEYLQAIEVPSTGAFKFPVPDSIIQDLINLSGENAALAKQAGSYKLLLLPKGSRLVVTLPDGAPLPTGIRYDAATKTFVVPKLGNVTLPLSVKVTLMRGTQTLSQKIMVVTK